MEQFFCGSAIFGAMGPTFCSPIGDLLPRAPEADPDTNTNTNANANTNTNANTNANTNTNTMGPTFCSPIGDLPRAPEVDL